MGCSSHGWQPASSSQPRTENRAPRGAVRAAQLTSPAWRAHPPGRCPRQRPGTENHPGMSTTPRSRRAQGPSKGLRGVRSTWGTPRFDGCRPGGGGCAARGYARGRGAPSWPRASHRRPAGFPFGSQPASPVLGPVVRRRRSSPHLGAGLPSGVALRSHRSPPPSDVEGSATRSASSSGRRAARARPPGARRRVVSCPPRSRAA